MTELVKTAPDGTEPQNHRHSDSMTESSPWGQFSETVCERGNEKGIECLLKQGCPMHVVNRPSVARAVLQIAL